jgi:ABC-type enterobactin transport system permease subunit
MDFFRAVILANYVSISGFIVVAIGGASFDNITKENLMSPDVRKFAAYFWNSFF